MKKWLCLLFICLPLASSAQSKKGILQFLRGNTFSNSLQRNLERALARTRLVARQPHALSKLVLRSTPAPACQPFLKKDLVLSPFQKENWSSRYHQLLSEFEQFKKQSAPFLYYQSIPLEARELSAQEKRQWLDKMLPLYSKILALYVNTQKDATLKYALDYLRYGVCMTDPFLASTLPTDAKPYAAPFDADAFFLYPQEPLPEPGVDLENKLIAIINDDKSLLEHFEHLSDIGVLFPQASLHTNGDALQFLLWMRRVPRQPDIIFTDIQLGENNGYYIARRLRESGYQGGIIALTSYTQTEAYARQLAQGGFDGMVSLDDQYYGKIPFSLRLTQAAQVYLRRQNR